MGSGMAWDCSMGVFCDFAGNDHYLATGGLTQGTGARWASASSSTTTATTSTRATARAMPRRASPITMHACGGNFSFLIDYGGNDHYGCGADNNTYLERGDAGRLFDRPAAARRAAPTAKPPAAHATARR